ELIDAVDVDGDGLAELLFREYSFDQKGFIIYGAGRGAVTKVFEGATSPLRPSILAKTHFCASICLASAACIPFGCICRYLLSASAAAGALPALVSAAP